METREALDAARKDERETLDRIRGEIQQYYDRTGIRIMQIDCPWRQFGNLSERPGTWVLHDLEDNAEWR